MVELQVPRPAAGPNGSFTLTLSSRLEFSWAVGPPKEMKNGSHAATALHGRATLHLVIPSEAEGPAVQRTFRGNVFGQGPPGFLPRPRVRLSVKPHEVRQRH